MQPVGADLRDLVFVSAQAVIFWRSHRARSCCCSGAPLVALTLYQRIVRPRLAWPNRRPRRPTASPDFGTGARSRRTRAACRPRPVAGGGTGRCTLCLIDIDRFKQVNDRHGHLTGDALLETLGARDRGDRARSRLPPRRRRVRPVPRGDGRRRGARVDRAPAEFAEQHAERAATEP